MGEMVKRVWPYAAGIAVLVLYQWFVWPVMADIRDDWSFLHGARMQAIQQMQQQKAKAVEQ